jgi:hypothetical protein
MYIYSLSLRMTDTMTSRNIDLSTWDTLCFSQVVLLTYDKSMKGSRDLSIQNIVVCMLWLAPIADIGSFFRKLVTVWSTELQILLFFYLHCSYCFYSVLLRCRGVMFNLWIYTQSVGLLGRVIGPSQGPYLNTGQHKHRINAHTHTKHPCPKWYLNPRLQRPSERRQFTMP